MPAAPQAPDAADAHLSRELLDRFFAGSVTVGELGERAVAHLTARCDECRRRVGRRDWSAVFRDGAIRAADRLARLADEREALSDHLAFLLPLSTEEIRRRVAEDERFATLGFVEHQLEVAWTAFEMGDAAVVEEACWLALIVLRRLRPEIYGKGALARFEAERYLLEARRHARLGAAPNDARAHAYAGRRLVAEAGEPADLLALAYLAGAETRFLTRRARHAGIFARTAGELAAVRRTKGADDPHWLWHALRLASASDRLAGEPMFVVRRLSGLFGAAPPADALEWATARELLFAQAEAGEPDAAIERLHSWTAQMVDDGVADDPNRVVQVGLATGGLGRRCGDPERACGALEEAMTAARRYGHFDDMAAVLVELAHCHAALGSTEALREHLDPPRGWSELSDATPVALHALLRLSVALSFPSPKGIDFGALERASSLGEPGLARNWRGTGDAR